MVKKIKKVDKKKIEKSILKRLKSLLGNLGDEANSITKDIRKVSKKLADKLSRKVGKAKIDNKSGKSKATKRDKEEEKDKKVVLKENRVKNDKNTRKKDKKKTIIASNSADEKAPLTEDISTDINAIRKSQSIGQSKTSDDPVNQQVEPELPQKSSDNRSADANLDAKIPVNTNVEIADEKPVHQKRATKNNYKSSGEVSKREVARKVQKSGVTKKGTTNDTE